MTHLTHHDILHYKIGNRSPSFSSCSPLVSFWGVGLGDWDGAAVSCAGDDIGAGDASGVGTDGGAAGLGDAVAAEIGAVVVAGSGVVFIAGLVVAVVGDAVSLGRSVAVGVVAAAFGVAGAGVGEPDAICASSVSSVPSGATASRAASDFTKYLPTHKPQRKTIKRITTISIIRFMFITWAAKLSWPPISAFLTATAFSRDLEVFPFVRFCSSCIASRNDVCFTVTDQFNCRGLKIFTHDVPPLIRELCLSGFSVQI